MQERVLWMTGSIKERVIRSMNEKDERCVIKFVFQNGEYIPDMIMPCILCEKPVNKLRDQLSIREFYISGMCQDCQDSAFGEYNE